MRKTNLLTACYKEGYKGVYKSKESLFPGFGSTSEKSVKTLPGIGIVHGHALAENGFENTLLKKNVQTLNTTKPVEQIPSNRQTVMDA